MRCTYCRGDGHEGQEPCNRCGGSGEVAPLVNHYDMCLAADFADGTSLYVRDNEAGGQSYYSDEVGCGVLVWDTALVSARTVEAALAHAKQSEGKRSKGPVGRDSL